MKVYTTEARIISTVNDCGDFLQEMAESERTNKDFTLSPFVGKILIIDNGRGYKDYGKDEYQQGVRYWDMLLTFARHRKVEVSLIIDEGNLQNIDPRIRKHIETKEVLG